MNENRVAGTEKETIEEMLSSVKEAFGMEIAFISEFVGDRLVFRRIEGDAQSFGFKEGGDISLEGSYCKRVIEGRIPGVVTDARSDAETRDLPVTGEADIGSYIAVPLRLQDGRPYGTLCCMSHTPDYWLRERDLKLMERLAQRMVARLGEEGLL